MKKEMKENLRSGFEMFADQHFKSVVGMVEVHKLRYGSYPASLNNLKFVNGMDSIAFKSVVYKKLDTTYELNLRENYLGVQGDTSQAIQLKLPEEFWQGLGCSKSNVR